MADDATELQRLKAENARLSAELTQTKQTVAAEKGPAAGTVVCYQREGESFCRPGKVISEGFTEHVSAGGGMTQHHALIEYGGGQSGDPKHSFETDRPWDPSGRPNTWHLPDECPRHGGLGCPFTQGSAPQAPPQAP